jgi:hypothetical protein
MAEYLLTINRKYIKGIVLRARGKVNNILKHFCFREIEDDPLF